MKLQQPMPWWAAIGTPDPEKNEAAGGQRLQGYNDSADGVHCSDPEASLHAHLVAEFALAGWAFSDLKSGGYLVSKWGRSRHVMDLAGAEAFLAEVKGVRS